MINMNPRDEILKLKDGESWIWPESDYGKAEIRRVGDYLDLYEIPLFGGEPIFYERFIKENIELIIVEVNDWK